MIRETKEILENEVLQVRKEIPGHEDLRASRETLESGDLQVRKVIKEILENEVLQVRKEIREIPANEDHRER